MAVRILIADDEEVIRDSVRLCLQGRGYEIHEAKDGPEALAMAREIKPDLLILDVLMPGMVGYRVCRELKDDPQTKDIFIIFLTYRGQRQAQSTMLLSGADDFIPKPFEVEELRKKVDLAIKK